MNSLKYAVLSAFMGSLGPFFNKQAKTDSSALIPGMLEMWTTSRAPVYTYVVICIGLMLFFNTLSVKYKMLSYKYCGAFLGTSVTFLLIFLFSAMLDSVVGEPGMSWQRLLGAGMMAAGVALISMQRAEDKTGDNSHNSIIAVVEASFRRSTEETYRPAEQKSPEAHVESADPKCTENEEKIPSLSQIELGFKLSALDDLDDHYIMTPVHAMMSSAIEMVAGQIEQTCITIAQREPEPEEQTVPAQI